MSVIGESEFFFWVAHQKLTFYVLVALSVGSMPKDSLTHRELMAKDITGASVSAVWDA